MAKKYELGVQFCAERLMLINGALDAANKDTKSPGAEALRKLASEWAVDLVEGEFIEETEDTSISKGDIEDALGVGEMTITQIAKACESDVKTVRPVLHKMLKDGKVVSSGEKRSTVYKVATAPLTVN